MLPADGSLEHRDFQLFLKRLRKRYSGRTVRYFMCGEYGEECAECGRNREDCQSVRSHTFRPTLGRPHHHVCIFGYYPKDAQFYTIGKGGEPLYKSEDVTKIWANGYVTVGDVTWESAAYIARYVVKKITGGAAQKHYGIRQPEYLTMSNRPGIGAAWLDKFFNDVYPYDEVVRQDKKFHPPKYYDKQLEKMNPEALKTIKQRRIDNVNKKEIESFKRLACKEEIKIIQSKQLKRKFINDY